MNIDIRLVLPIRDVADGCMRRSHMSKRQPTSLDKFDCTGRLAHLWGWREGYVDHATVGARILVHSVTGISVLDSWKVGSSCRRQRNISQILDPFGYTSEILSGFGSMGSKAACKMSHIPGFLSGALHTLWLESPAEAFSIRFSAIAAVKFNNITHHVGTEFRPRLRLYRSFEKLILRSYSCARSM